MLLHRWICGRLFFQDGGHNGWAYIMTYQWHKEQDEQTAQGSYNVSRLMTKPTKWHMRPAKTQINLGIRLVWSESSLSAWWKLGSLATHWVHSAGRTVILLVLSWGGSYTVYTKAKKPALISPKMLDWTDTTQNRSVLDVRRQPTTISGNFE